MEKTSHDPLRHRGRFGLILLLLLFATLVSVIIAAALGTVSVPFSDSYRILLHKIFGVGDLEGVSNSFINIIWELRMPRVLMGLLIGMGLSLCGAIMQATVQNPLADPYILGVSAGASLGATFSILIGFGALGFAQMGIGLGAFAGAAGASLLVLTIASLGGKPSSVKLILAGTVINALCTAFSNFIVYFSGDSEGIRSVTFWMMGSLASAKWDKLPTLCLAILGVGAFFLTQSRVLNTMLLGDEAAITLGVDLGRRRKIYLLLSALITGIAVANCGMIGFVGLIVPHIVRGVSGSDHRRLIPLCALSGALFMTWADVISRIILPKNEISIGIVTSMIGAPLFMYILIRKGYGFGRQQ